MLADVALAGPFVRTATLTHHARGGTAVAATRWQVAVGASYDTPGVLDLYDRRTLELQATASAGVPDDRFGSAVAPLGAEFAVGARGTGTIHVVRPDGSIRLTIPYPGVLTGDGVRVARFGAAVGTGLGVIVAVSNDVPPDEPTRRLWAFDGRDGALRWQRDLPAATDGPAVAVDRRLIAVPGGYGPTGARRVLLFDVRDGRALGAIDPPAGQPAAWFGFALALDRGRLLVSSPDLGAPGAVYQYRVPNGRLEQVYPAPPDPGLATASGGTLAFGNAVALSRRHVAIGASHVVLPGVSRTSGALYVYDRRSGAPVQRLLPYWSGGSGYGGVVAAAGERLFVGYATDWDGQIDVLESGDGWW